MKLKLLVLAVGLLIIALAIHREVEPGQVEVQASSDLVAPTASTTELARLDAAAVPQAESTRVAAEPELEESEDASPANLTVIEVLALDRKGSRLEDIAVELNLGSEFIVRDDQLENLWKIELEGNPGQRTGAIARTDSHGVVKFRIKGAALARSTAKLTLAGRNHSAEQDLELPVQSQRLSITLECHASAEVKLIDANGEPIENAIVEACQAASPSNLPGSRTSSKTNERGIASFGRMLEGPYDFSYLDEQSSRSVSQTAQVDCDEKRSIELRCTPSSDPLCVAGTVRDESGNPLPGIGLHLRVDAGREISIRSQPGGEFALRCAPGREVELIIGGGVRDDIFEPSSLRLPFGTNDIRIRRTRVVGKISVELSGLDAKSGDPVHVEGWSFRFYRAGRRAERSEFIFLDGNERSLQLRDHDDGHVIVSAFGYLDQDIALADALQRDANGARLVVRLVRAPDYKPNVEEQ